MSATDTSALPDYASVPRSALGPALNEQGYHVGRVERNLYRVTDGVYKAAVVKGYLDTVSHLAAQRVIEKYTGLPGAADVFTDDVAFRRWSRSGVPGGGAGARRRRLIVTALWTEMCLAYPARGSPAGADW